MRKFSKRFLTMLLVAAMVFGLSGMTAFAAQTGDAASEPVALADDDVTYGNIVIYHDGGEVVTVTGEEFAEAADKAGEQTFVYYSGAGMGDETSVTANFVSVSTLLGGNKPASGCGISILTQGEISGGTAFQASEMESLYVYYDTDRESYRTAVNGSVGSLWISGVTGIVLGHQYIGANCTICGADTPGYEGGGGGGDVGEYEADYRWYTENPNANTFEISTPQQLAGLSNIVNDTADGIDQDSFYEKTVYLTQNIAMNEEGSVGFSYKYAGEEGASAVITTVELGDDVYGFTPIGNMRFDSNGYMTSGHAFEGTFDGNGHTIENLYVRGDEYVGLFGVVGGTKTPGEDGYGVVKNFKLTGVVECTGDGLDFAAGVCAKLNAGGTIENVINYAVVEAPDTYNVGGIAGFAGTPVKWGGSDHPDIYTGNPSGYNTYVLSCGNEALIHGFYKQGGIVGENAATVMYCYNKGWILPHETNKNGGWGGIVGRNGNNNTATEESVVAYCYNTGTITNNGRNDDYSDTVKGYAGIVGQEFGAKGKNEVYSCYNIGAIPVGYNRYNSVLSGPPEGAAVAVLYNNYTLNDPDRIHNYVDSSDTIETAELESGIKVEADEFKVTDYGDDDILTKLGACYVADTDNRNEGYPVLWWQEDGTDEPVITDLKIEAGPSKTTYAAGETFDPTGMVVVAYYGDKIREIVPAGYGRYDDMWYARQGGYSFKTDPLTGADSEITVEYKGYTATQKIAVTGSTLTSLEVTPPDKTIYSVGETFDPTGMTITAVFNNGDYSTKLTTDQVTFDPGLDHELQLTDTQIKVTFTLGDQHASALVNITVSEAPPTDSEGRYMISNVSDLEWFSNQVNYESNPAIDAIVTADIDASESESFEPIGRLSSPFEGTFDGGGHTITLDVDQTDSTDKNFSERNAAGVVGNANGATVCNVTTRGTVVGLNKVGGVVGQIDGGSVTNCTNYAEVFNDSLYSSGVVAYAENGTVVDGCTNYGKIEAKSYTGGVVGYLDSACTVSNCFNKETISAYNWMGGVIGRANTNCTITDCGNDADVTALSGGYPVGGIVGLSNSNISTCYNKGNVEGEYQVGGIVGNMGQNSIESCYNTGAITADTSVDSLTFAAGGIAGYCSGAANYTNLYENLFNTGVVTTKNEKAGALIGANGSRSITISNSYYLEGTAEQACLQNSAEVKLENVASKKAEEIASEEFLPLINGSEAFKYVGGGHPLLTWEVHDAHTWGEPDWNWDEDYSSATASRTCTVCGLKETVEGEISMEITKVPTVSEDGSTTYTAKATFEDGTAVENIQVVVTPKVDTTELNDAIDAADALNGEDYTTSSWEALEEALTAAKQVVVTGSTATQDEVDEALRNLNTAMSNLVELADKSDLEDAIAEAEAKDEDAYTPASWEALQEALTAAEAVAAKDNPTQDEVSKAVKDLRDAMNALVPVADKTSLKAAIAEAEAKDEVAYTPASWEALQQALAAAEKVAGDENASQDAVDEATSNLQEAIGNLVERGDKTELEAVIAEADALSADAFTEESWNALQTALDAAKTVDSDVNASEADVTAAKEALESAIGNLQPANPAVDKSELGNAIAEAQKLKEADYTPGSWVNLQTALDAAKTVYEKENATENEVQEAFEALETAIANLEPAEEQHETVDKSGLEKEIDEVEKEMEGLNKEDYTEDSWKALEEALTAAEKVAADENATQAQVEAAEEALKTAMDNLKPAYNGVVKVNGVWGYYVNNELQEHYTGVAPVKNENGWWYIKDGLVDFSANTVAKNQNGWWYVNDGKVNFDFTGLGNYGNSNGWWYINGGKVTFDHNGVDKNVNGWWYVVDSKVQFGFTGLANYKNANGWWYIVNGAVDFTHNGVDKNNNGWWYVTGGQVQFGFTGLANYSNANGWWYIVNGAVDFTHTGVEKNNNGWWYVTGGKVDFGFTGIAVNANGTWYIRNGAVDFSFSGSVSAGGRIYTVVNGKVQS